MPILPSRTALSFGTSPLTSSLRRPSRAVGEHGAVRQVGGHVGEQRGPHGSVPSSVPAGRGGGEDRPAAPGPGQRRLLPLLRVTGRLRPPHHRRQGTTGSAGRFCLTLL